MKNFFILFLVFIVIVLGYLQFKSNGAIKENKVVGTQQGSIGGLESEYVKKISLACKESIKPELEEFYKNYKGGGNSGLVMSEKIFYECLGRELTNQSELRSYISAHAEEWGIPVMSN